MTDQEITRRILCALIGAFCVIRIFSGLVGEKRKRKWFKVRKSFFTFNFFNFRGGLGQSWLFGRPKTWEGLAVALALVACIALETALIFLV